MDVIEEWILQRRFKQDADEDDTWGFVEEYQNPTAARERLEFKRTRGWDRLDCDYRVVRLTITPTVEDW